MLNCVNRRVNAINPAALVKIKNTCSGLDQYGAEPFEQQQFQTAGVEGVNERVLELTSTCCYSQGKIKHPAVQVRSAVHLVSYKTIHVSCILASNPWVCETRKCLFTSSFFGREVHERPNVRN